ncbi:MAG: hypothetical protein JKY13_02785, partial [Gammaproteobacteria bacterium]|nr:hypothetical protein [Gammaproteobacteria bacterium]
TALAARHLAEGKLPRDSAVIANAACAEHFQLTILRKGIQSSTKNDTFFVAISHHRELLND